MEKTATLKDLLTTDEASILNDTFPDMIEKWVFMLTVQDLRRLGAIINTQLENRLKIVEYDVWTLEILKNRAKKEGFII